MERKKELLKFNKSIIDALEIFSAMLKVEKRKILKNHFD
jgi:hypothetical protein